MEFIRIVPFGVLGKIVNRPESRIRRCVQEKNIESLHEQIGLANAVRICLAMAPYNSKKQRKVKFRLPLPTLLLAHRYCIEHHCSAETLYRLAATGLTLLLRDTNIIEHAIPNRSVRGNQVQLRHFCPYTYNAMRVTAWAFHTKPSAIMDWALHQYFVTELQDQTG